MDKNTYQGELLNLQDVMKNVANTPFSIFAKVTVLMVLNMRYEKIAFNKELSVHPYILTRDIIKDAGAHFLAWMETAFIEGENRDLGVLKSSKKEEKHHDLFNKMWDKYGEKEYEEYIKRYMHRLQVNHLQELIRDRKCIDFGCGNGNFCFALLRCGAAFVAGVDFGENSVAFAQEYSENQGWQGRSKFHVATVYDTGFADNEFDFAIQNGVFHHLEDEERAIGEVCRVLKQGGWFWYYTTGAGSISRELWDVSIDILKDVPSEMVAAILEMMNVSRNKIVHLTDGLNATYTATTWEAITARLAAAGFGNFRRLTGGFDTDFDLDRIESDPYGREKFGAGDLRILAQLVEK
mgnify:CR=1 FL=1